MKNYAFRDLLYAIAILFIFWIVLLPIAEDYIPKQRSAPRTDDATLNREIAAAIAMQEVEHERTLQSVKAAAAKEVELARTQVAEARRTAEAAHGADFEAGLAAGKAQAQAELEAKLELARNKEFERGRLLGSAEVESTAVDKWRTIGEEFGRMKGHEEARREFESELQVATEQARADTQGEAFTRGVREGKSLAERTGRLEASIPAFCLTAILICIGTYALLRRHVLQPAQIYKEVLPSNEANGNGHSTEVRRLINQTRFAGMQIND